MTRLPRLFLLLASLLLLPGGAALTGCDASDPAGPIGPPTGGSSCCRVCTTGRACGDSCINRNYTCNQPPGCACNG